MQGDLDASIIRLLSGVSASGDVAIDVGQAVTLLEQFKEESGKQQVYGKYVDCVIQTVAAISGVQSDAGEEIIIENSIVPAPLSIIKPGQRFAMATGDAWALSSQLRILTLDNIEGNKTFANFEVADLETGKSKSFRVSRGETFSAYGSNCSLALYKVDYDLGNVSILYHCSEQ